jgi:hypothetical protein
MTDMKTDYGTVHAGGACRDNYPSVQLYHRDHDTVKLQGPAMRSFKECEDIYGERTKRPSDTRYILLSGSWRSCAYQTSLYRSDSHRYAAPGTSLHCRGLAIDVINPVPAIVRQILLAHGWHQVRPSDEPWHFSFGFTA